MQSHSHSSLNISWTVSSDTNFATGKDKIMIASKYRIHTRMHDTLRIVRNTEVNQSRGVTCYSSGFPYHQRQLICFNNINDSCCVRVPRVL